MSIALCEFGLNLRADWITNASEAFRPTEWPPAREWPTSVDRHGKVLSRWGDPIWDFTPMAGRLFKLNFGDGAECQSDPLDPANADILRLIITWRIWGPRGIRTVGTLQASFTRIRSVIALCSRNGIQASDLMRFQRVFDQLPQVLSPGRYEQTLADLHRLYDARQSLGFTIVDQAGLKRLAGARPDHDAVQTPYIPSRIWVYQVRRLHECLDDFNTQRAKIEACFQFCLDAYAHNYGSLRAALEKGKDGDKSPFTIASKNRIGCVYLSTFADAADRFNLTPLLLKWIAGKRNALKVRTLSTYLNLVNVAGLAYIANFTLQRKEEVASLRASCLVWEKDEKLGRVPLICGETTKTDSDSDARWVASPSVEIAIQAMAAISRLRMTCNRENPLAALTAEDVDDPYLFSAPCEPWGSGKVTAYHLRRKVASLAETIRDYPKLFDLETLRITHEDQKVALQLTPNLPTDKFAVGQAWPLAWHQYRRTSAVNMFASGLISDSSMQQQMKHCSRLMPLYYGRGYTRLHLNENVEAAVVSAMYEAMAAQLQSAVSDRYISPDSAERKQALTVNILSTKDAKTLTAWAKSGKVSFREHRLGGCMKAGACDYGGVESVARCAGGDGGKPCADVLFDREKEPQVRIDLDRIGAEMARLPKDSPRYRALLSDRRGMENYLNVIDAS